MQSNTSLQGTTTSKPYTIFPASPKLLERLNINSPLFLSKRKEILELKNQEYQDDKLRPYQKMALNFLLNSGLNGIGIFDEQRLGKTPTILTALKYKKAKALIIVPKSLIYPWYFEYKKWYNDEVSVIDGTVQQRKKQYETKNSLILSYNTASIDKEIIEKNCKNFNYIIIDEAHRIRNIKKSKKYKPKEATAVLELAKTIPNRIALSGTPSPNYADDIFGILKYLYPDIFNSYYNFYDYYFNREEQYVRQPNGQLQTILKHPESFKQGKKQELLEFIETISLQRKRKDVMQWLPKYNVNTMVLKQSNLQEKVSKELRLYYEYKDIIAINELDLMIKLRQISVSPQTLNINDAGCKFEFIENYLKDYEEQSIIIVSTFVEPLKLLQDKLKDAKLMIGDTPTKERNNIKDAFQNRQCKIILANLNVIKEGFTLDSADTIIFLDSSFTYTDNIQCMDRLVPVNQDNIHDSNQNIIILIAEQSIDEYIYDMVYVKKAKSTDIINNYIKYLRKE